MAEAIGVAGAICSLLKAVAGCIKRINAVSHAPSDARHVREELISAEACLTYLDGSLRRSKRISANFRRTWVATTEEVLKNFQITADELRRRLGGKGAGFSPWRRIVWVHSSAETGKLLQQLRGYIQMLHLAQNSLLQCVTPIPEIGDSLTSSRKDVHELLRSDRLIRDELGCVGRYPLSSASASRLSLTISAAESLLSESVNPVSRSSTPQPTSNAPLASVPGPSLPLMPPLSIRNSSAQPQPETLPCLQLANGSLNGLRPEFVGFVSDFIVPSPKPKAQWSVEERMKLQNGISLSDGYVSFYWNERSPMPFMSMVFRPLDDPDHPSEYKVSDQSKWHFVEVEGIKGLLRFYHIQLYPGVCLKLKMTSDDLSPSMISISEWERFLTKYFDKIGDAARKLRSQEEERRRRAERIAFNRAYIKQRKY